MKASHLLPLLLCAWAPFAWSYEETVTHRDLTARAIESSSLIKDSGLQKDLGLYPFKACPRFPWGSFVVVSDSLACHLQQGAIDEDEFPNSLAHFYDPISGLPLNALGIPMSFPPYVHPSPDWILEDNGAISVQAYSYQDARRHMKQALLTPSTQSEWREHWEAVFQSLGHVVHHVQDMAQPQHVRNDGHLKLSWWYWLPPVIWPVYYFISSPSRYEQYTHDKPGRVLGLAENAGAAYPGVAPAASEFKLPRDFWKNSAYTGMAEYTNRTFVSHGSNFSTNPLGEPSASEKYAQPVPNGSREYTLGELYDEQGESAPHLIRLQCPLLDCKMKMISTSDLKKASTYSIFDQDLSARGRPLIYSLNRFNFDEAHTVLIPKAANYSAGLINYFFRGRLQVTPPDQGKGVYAVVNHTAGAGDGFTTLKATVKNITPGETLLGGQVVGVVRYHLNDCYTPDLKGDFATDLSVPDSWIYPECKPGQVYRTAQEFTLQTEPQGLTLMSGSERELTFKLPRPLPFGATDVYLQVIYTGQMGSETDSIAVGTADISEPTYVAIFNATDTYEIPVEPTRSKIFLVREIIEGIKDPPYSIVDSNKDGIYASPPDVGIRGAPLQVELYVDGAGSSYRKIATLNALPEGRFTRTALLAKPGTFKFYVSLYGGAFNAVHTYSLVTKGSQLEWNESSKRYEYYVSRSFDLRQKQSRQFHALVYRNYYLIRGADTLTMPASEATDAARPVDAEIIR